MVSMGLINFYWLMGEVVIGLLVIGLLGYWLLSYWLLVACLVPIILTRD